MTINLLIGAASDGNSAGDILMNFESVTGSSGGDNLTGKTTVPTRSRGGPGGDT